MRTQAKMRLILAFMAALLVGLAPAEGWAQGPPPVRGGGQGQGRGPGQGGDRQQMEARLQRMMGERIKAELGMTDEEFGAFSEQMNPFRDRRVELSRRQVATRLRIQAVLQDGGKEGESEELLRTLSELGAEEMALAREEFDFLAEVLTPEQRLRFLAVREEINRRIQRARWRNPGDGAGPPGGGDGPGSGPRGGAGAPGIDLYPGLL